ncbi:MAG TPA: transposase [Nitrospiria bacterium]|nr:transposase [Nitrospiria bacterium]
MARPLRLEFPGALYHVTARGNAQQAIYVDDEDCRAFCRCLAVAVERYDWRVHAYCLMDNHYHLVIETLRPTLARGMRHLNGTYTQRVNRRHHRVGHLFQGRYKAILVEREPYLLELCRYVVLNPVRANACRRPEQWRWSSFRATAGLESPPAWLTTEWVLAQFGTTKGRAQTAYRTFVSDRAPQRPWDALRNQIYLGTETFVDSLPLTPTSMAEVPRAQRHRQRPTLAALLRTRRPSPQAIAVAYREHGYRLREIADHCGVHYATISRRLRAAEDGAGAGPTPNS